MTGRIRGLRGELVERLRAWSRRQRSTWIELLVRDDIERARTVLRLNDFADCDAMLRSAERRLTVEPDETHGILAAVILSLRAQALRAQASFTGGATDAADEAFHAAVAAFAAADQTMLQPRDRADLGIALAAVGQSKPARIELEAAVADDKAPPEASRELARVYLELEKPGKAKPLIEKAISALPGDPQLYLLKAAAFQADSGAAADAFTQAGVLFLSSDRPAEALAAADRALASKADVPGVAGVRAEALRQLGRNKEALPDFERALRETENAQLYVRRAMARAAAGDATGAATDVERALQLDPEGVDVLVLASIVRRDAGDQRSAHELATQAYKQQPGNWRALLRMAEAWREAGDPLRALGVLRTAGPQARTQPEVLRLHLELAVAYADREEALDLLNRLSDRAQLSADETYVQAQLLANSGRPNEAIATTSRGVQQWAGDLDLRLLDVELKLERKDVAAALASAEEGVQQHPDRPGIHLLKAVALLAEDPTAQRREAALAAIERAAELDTDWAEPWWLRAQVAWRDGDATATRAALTEVFARDPDHLLARRMEVWLHLSDREYTEAERLARELAGNDQPIGTLALAQVLDAQHREAQASAELNRLDESEFDDIDDAVEMLTLRARLSTDLLDFEAADRDLAQLAELTGDTAELFRLRSMLARARGDGAGAVGYAARALEAEPDDLDMHFEALWAYELADNQLEAERIRRQLEESWPDDREVRLWKARVLALTDPARARADVVELIAEDPTDLAAVTELARQDFNQGRYAESLEQLSAIGEDQLDVEILALRAEASRMLDRPDQAIADARAALELVPRHADSLATLGLALLATRDTAQAIDVFELARQASPEDLALRRWLGLAYARDQRFDDALALLDAVAFEQTEAAPMADLADLLSDAGAYRLAAPLYRAACALDPKDSDAWSSLGWCLENDLPPDLVAAEDAFRTASGLSDDLWARKNLADVLHLGSERPRAASIYGAVHADIAARRSEQVDLMGLDGWCLFRLGQLEAAARVLYEASNAQPRTTGEHFDLALVTLCAGQPRGTITYEQLIPLADIHPQLRRGLLRVAYVDLEQARVDFPETAGGAGGQRVLELLAGALDALPPLPEVKTVKLIMDQPAQLFADLTATEQPRPSGDPPSSMS